MGVGSSESSRTTVIGKQSSTMTTGSRGQSRRFCPVLFLLVVIHSFYLSLSLMYNSEKSSEEFLAPSLTQKQLTTIQRSASATVRNETFRGPAVSPSGDSNPIRNRFHRHLDLDDRDGFSACLLMSEDNHYLVEWLAYHYWFLPLRRLIVAVDPASRTLPTAILNRYRNLVDITVWNDTLVFGPQSWNGTRDTTITTQIREDMTFNAMEQVVKLPQNRLLRHRFRQSLFFSKCLAQLRKEGRTWVALVDTDEYITVHSGASDEYRIRDIQPTLYRMLESPQNSSPDTLDLNTTSCINLRRDQMSALKKISDENVTTASPQLASQRKNDSSLDWLWNISNYNTLQFRYRAHYYQVFGQLSRVGGFNNSGEIFFDQDSEGQDAKDQRHPAPKLKAKNKRRSLAGKCIVHASRIADDLRLRYDRVGPHRPTTDCPPGKTRIPPFKAPLIVHHYPGTWEQFSFRQSSDPRQGVRDQGRYLEYSRMKHVHYTEDLSPEWVKQFINLVGTEQAEALLRSIGTVERLPVAATPSNNGLSTSYQGR